MASADTRLSPEIRLIAAAIRPQAQSGAADALRAAAAATLDWNLVLALARRHRVVPRVAFELARCDISVPESPQQAFLDGLAAAAFEELAQLAAVKELTRTLSRAGVRVTVLKGVSLSLRLHGRLGLRTSRDIDLLVAPHQVEHAMQLLATFGCGPLHAPTAAPSATFERYRRQYKDIELFAPPGKLIVELHWRLFDNPRLMPLAESFSVVPSASSTGFEWNTLPPDLELRYLATHGAQHAWSRLKWLADFAGLSSSLGATRCEQIFAMTSIADGRRCLAQAMRLCNIFFAMPLSASVARSIADDRRVRWLTDVAMQCVLRGGTHELEALRFGSTAKNLSHYFISGAADYVFAEIAFDLRAPSRSPSQWHWRALGPFGRIGEWVGHHIRPTPK